IFPDNMIGPWPARWSSEFSSNNDNLYVSSTPDTTYLIQYDLNAPNIALSGDTIWTFSDIFYSGHALKRGPDDKIYFSSCYNNGSFPYPYPDSVYNTINMNLGVINSPNNLGATCDFQPFSFYLGGKRTYWGLPNNPNYDMPALAGSVCDSLVGLSETTPTIITSQLNIFYHPHWQTAFINASNLTGTKGTMEIFDVQGKLVHREEIEIQNGYYTRNFNMSGKADGMYFVNLIIKGKRLSQKFVKE
ncbi:MAG TPA: T9SS type A sorting domain-containing protein, partial [Bacteroidia bacterium]|nr:T9SS type A sorting domain-containing protein [Bacteroidia bacterium]